MTQNHQQLLNSVHHRICSLKYQILRLGDGTDALETNGIKIPVEKNANIIRTPKRGDDDGLLYGCRICKANGIDWLYLVPMKLLQINHAI